MRTLRIGDLELSSHLLLAPMAGYCELPFRLIVRRLGGVGLAYTPLLSPKGVMYGTQKTRDLAASCAEDSPLGMQFFGGDAGELCEAVRWAEDGGADLIDINMGCSVPKVVRNNGGSSLLRDPDAALRLVEQVMTAVRRVPLTVKMRLGWDERCVVAPYLAARLEEIGVAAVTVHGRTASMKFSGKAQLDGIAATVAAVKRIPVIGNGDVRTPQDAEAMLRETGCAGVMIGRGALLNPWIFRDTVTYFETGAVPAFRPVEEKCELMRRHFGLSVELHGERSAVLEFRKFGPWYARHIGPCRMLREGFPKIKSAAGFNELLDQFLAGQGGGQARNAPDGIAYPRRWEYRIIGASDRLLRDAIAEAIRGLEYDLQFSQFSRTGRYISFVLGVTVLDEQHRDSLYRNLSGDPRIKFVL